MEYIIFQKVMDSLSLFNKNVVHGPFSGSGYFGLEGWIRSFRGAVSGTEFTTCRTDPVNLDLDPQ